MRLSEIRDQLHKVDTLNFKLPEGTYVPGHFHVTEVGLITKHVIDCGGNVRKEKLASLQLWNANDTHHRLKPGKLLKIIALAEQVLGDEDLEIEVEYQTETIGKYGLHFNGVDFLLIPKHTACLAQDACGTPKEKHKVPLSGLTSAACCTPGSGCC